MRLYFDVNPLRENERKTYDTCSVAKPDPVPFLPWIRDEHPGSYFPENLETIFWVKIIPYFFDGSGSGIRNLFDPISGIENSDPGSGTSRIRNTGLVDINF